MNRRSFLTSLFGAVVAVVVTPLVSLAKNFGRRGVHNVRDYGARTDGSDCTKAFQDAVSAAQADVQAGTVAVYIPKGCYNISSPAVYSSVRLRGHHKNTTLCIRN